MARRIADAVAAQARLASRHTLFQTSQTPLTRMCQVVSELSPVLSRLVFGPFRSHSEYLEWVALADVVVDPYPFGQWLPVLQAEAGVTVGWGHAATGSRYL